MAEPSTALISGVQQGLVASSRCWDPVKRRWRAWEFWYFYQGYSGQFWQNVFWGVANKVYWNEHIVVSVSTVSKIVSLKVLHESTFFCHSCPWAVSGIAAYPHSSDRWPHIPGGVLSGGKNVNLYFLLLYNPFKLWAHRCFTSLLHS